MCPERNSDRLIAEEGSIIPELQMLNCLQRNSAKSKAQKEDKKRLRREQREAEGTIEAEPGRALEHVKAESAAAVSDEDDAISMRMDLADSSSSDSDNHFGTRTGRRERVGRKDRIKVPQAEGMPPAPSKTQIPIAEHGDASSDDIPSDPRLTAQGEDLVKTIAGGQEDDMTDAQEEKKVLTQMLQSPEDEDHESYGQQTGMDSVVKFSTINVSTRSGSYNRSGRGMPYSSADCANTIKAPSIRPSDITEKEIKAHQPNNNKGLSSKSLKRQRYREREQARRAEEEEEAAMDVDPAAIDGTTSLRSPSTIPTDALPPPPTRMPIPDPTQEPPPPSAKDFKLVDGQLIPMAEWRRAKKARDRAKKRERKRFFKSQGKDMTAEEMQAEWQEKVRVREEAQEAMRIAAAKRRALAAAEVSRAVKEVGGRGDRKRRSREEEDDEEEEGGDLEAEAEGLGFKRLKIWEG